MNTGKNEMTSEDKKLHEAVLKFLQGDSNKLLRWFRRCPKVVRNTADKVVSLDSDLKDFVRSFLTSGRIEDADFGCEYATIQDLLESGDYTPVSAALMVQWFRDDPIHAASAALHHDDVVDIPEELPLGESEPVD